MRNEILQGDVLERLKDIQDGYVQTVVTSPPYWGLRDYGEDGQLGLESTPEEYVARIVDIFAEVRRVMRDDGTLWLNLGDSYAGGGRGFGYGGKQDTNKGCDGMPESIVPVGLKPKDLCGMPWRVAFALQADGWYLRSDIIWSKPNPMPESVTDRPTKAHEYMFLLTKKAKYYYDADAIREAHDIASHKRAQYKRPAGKGKDDPMVYQGVFEDYHLNPSGRNRRTVWEIATQPYPEAHFATFPEKLVEPCILAGSNDRACGICGAAWERVSEKENPPERACRRRTPEGQTRNTMPLNVNDAVPVIKTLGFRPTCEHDNGDSRSIILDPFMGSGTVALVALKLGRDYIGIELKPDYIEMAMQRLKPLGNRPCPQQEILI